MRSSSPIATSMSDAGSNSSLSLSTLSPIDEIKEPRSSGEKSETNSFLADNAGTDRASLLSDACSLQENETALGPTFSDATHSSECGHLLTEQLAHGFSFPTTEIEREQCSSSPSSDPTSMGSSSDLTTDSSVEERIFTSSQLR